MIEPAISRMMRPGVEVASFKNHFLWRIEQKLPVPREVMVFDRSHYETCWPCTSDGSCPRRCGVLATRRSSGSRNASPRPARRS